MTYYSANCAVIAENDDLSEMTEKRKRDKMEFCYA